MAFFCVYIEPRTRVGDIEKICDLISNEILQLKSSSNPLVFLGGDLNHRSLAPATQAFPDIVQVNWEPTRLDACLDVMLSNSPGLTSEVWPPLSTNQVVESNHSCVVLSGSIPQEKDYTWIKKTSRKYTDRAATEFGLALERADWDSILPGHLSSDELVQALEDFTTTLIDKLFPMRMVRIRSNELLMESRG